MSRWGCSCRLPIGLVPLHPKSPDGPFDVLESEFAQGMKLRPKAAIDRLAHRPRDDDPARRRFGLQTSGDVQPVPVKVVAIDNKVAHMQAHAEYERGVCG